MIIVYRFSRILFLSTLYIFCCNNLVGQSIKKYETYISYSSGGGHDNYYEGDQYGYRILIDFYGNVEEYIRYFPNQDVLSNTFKMSESHFGLLKSLFEEYDFNNYSNFPEDFILIGPSTDYVISYRPTKESELRSMQIFGGASKTSLPNWYREFYSKFKILINSISKIAI